MEKETVYVLMTELNGYKNIHGVFKDKAVAIDCGEHLTEQWAYKDHGVFIQPMTLL